MTQPPAQPSRTSAFAVASLCFGLLVFCCWPLTAIPAIVCGHVAWGDIRRNGNLRGQSMAVAGMSLGYFGLLISILVAVWLVLQAGVLFQTARDLQRVANLTSLGNQQFLPPPQNPVSTTNVFIEPTQELPSLMKVQVLSMLQPYTKAQPLLLPEKKDGAVPLKAMKVWLEGQNVMMLEDGATDPVQQSAEELDPAVFVRIMMALAGSGNSDDQNQEMIKKLIDQFQQLQPAK